MSPLKIAVIGGGSTYTPELIAGLYQQHLPVREVALVDPDLARLAIVGGLAGRMVAAAGGGLALTLTAELAPALDGADFVVTQLRVGGQAARIQDERIPLRYGLVGQETTGPGGFAKALRTIPVILDINRKMAERCPQAWLINFTNPSGLISEALRLHGSGHYVGLCNYPLTLKMNIARALQVEEADVTLGYFGLNHLSWARVLVDGEDRTEALIEIIIADPEFHELSGYAFDPACLRALGLIPSGYLRYYYDTDKMERELREAPQTRGERVREVEAQLLARYADPGVTAPPEELQQRGGAWYSTAAVRVMHDLCTAHAGHHVLNVPNRGSICTLPPEVIVEVPADVAAGRITACPTLIDCDGIACVHGYAVAESVIELMTRVKSYELHAVAAAVTGSREEASAALAAHPLLDGHHEVIPALMEELLTAHRAYLPQFFPEE